MADCSIKDLISQRRSVRTYNGTPLRTVDRQKLEAYTQSLQNPFGVSVIFRILDAKAQKLSSPVALGADTRFPFETLSFRNTFQEPLLPKSAGRFRDALEMVRLAPSAGNKQPWRIVICDGADTAFFAGDPGISRDMDTEYIISCRV